MRRAIEEARQLLGTDRPLSTTRFRTDGRGIFLQIIETDEHGQEREHLLDPLRRQYTFQKVLDPVLRSIDFNPGGEPMVWWPAGKAVSIVVDSGRSFGQPVDAKTGVPTTVLSVAAGSLGLRPAARARDRGAPGGRFRGIAGGWRTLGGVNVFFDLCTPLLVASTLAAAVLVAVPAQAAILDCRSLDDFDTAIRIEATKDGQPKVWAALDSKKLISG